MACRSLRALVALSIASAGCSASGTDESFSAGGPEADAGSLIDASSGAPDVNAPSSTPVSCAQAAASKSYVGCDYWPTVTANNVWSHFDFAVVVSNASTQPADVHVTGPNGFVADAVVDAGGLATIYLDWVPELKGPDPNACAEAVVPTASVLAPRSAYHLTSSTPVTVYQFNALQYKGEGGRPGKDWSTCPGKQNCVSLGKPSVPVGCYSFSNDASLLLPTTAMTGNYRIAGHYAWMFGGEPFMPSFVAITATQDATQVTFKSTGDVFAGAGIAGTVAGGTVTAVLDAGDVLQLMGGFEQQGGRAGDLSGSLLQADKPVQVISGMPCLQVPYGAGYCDHVEESMFPAETLGKDYIVTVPAGPGGGIAPAHEVRIVGNFDGTVVHFDPPVDLGANGVLVSETLLDAGQTVTVYEQSDDLHAWAEQPFLIATFMHGSTVVSGVQRIGDPSQNLVAATEQFRTDYVFLAPADYDVSYVTIVAPPEAGVMLDGAPVPEAQFHGVGGSSFRVARVELAAIGTHQLTATKRVGIEVYGYGRDTSYHVPGGLDLAWIAPAPPK